MSGILDRLATLAECNALPLQARVLFALLSFADSGGEAHPSVPGLARRLGVAERSIKRTLSALESAGAITCERRGKGGRGTGMTRWQVAPSATDETFLAFVNSDRNGHPSDPENSDETSHPLAPKGDGNGHPSYPQRVTDPGQKGDRSWSERVTESVTRTHPLTHVQPIGGSSAQAEWMDSPSARLDGPPARVPERRAREVLTLHGLSPGAGQFDVELRRALGDGLTREGLDTLCRRAKHEGRNPCALLFSWLTAGNWRDVLEGRRGRRFATRRDGGTVRIGEVLRRLGG